MQLKVALDCRHVQPHGDVVSAADVTTTESFLFPQCHKQQQQLTRFIGNQCEHWCLTPDRNSRSSHFRAVWDLRASTDVDYFGCFSVFKSVSSSVSLFSWILRRCFYREAPEMFWSVASDPSPSLKLSPRSGRRPAAQSDCQIEIKTVFTATTRRMNADPTNYRKNMNQTWDH